MQATGGAVLASNHVSYLDFIFAGLAGVGGWTQAGALMAKETPSSRKRWVRPLMRGMHHVPVDRDAVAGPSARRWGRARWAGEVVGVFPEATMSRSLTVKDSKSGAVRWSGGRRPLLPVAVWGGQRLFTKGRPRTLTRRHTPITILVGEPIRPGQHRGHLPRSPHELRTPDERRWSTGPSGSTRRQPAGPEDTWWLPAPSGRHRAHPGGSGRRWTAVGSDPPPPPDAPDAGTVIGYDPGGALDL